MTRQLLDGTLPPPLPLEGAVPPVPKSEPAPVATVQTAAPVMDALAGALPGWDLLPGNGFVRRRR